MIKNVQKYMIRKEKKKKMLGHRFLTMTISFHIIGDETVKNNIILSSTKRNKLTIV